VSIAGLAKTPRRIHRMSQVLQVLVKHGFGHIVRRMNLHTHLPVLNRLREGGAPPPGEIETIARRARLILQELGPTFVKLGQVLSTRPDVLPEEFIEELRRLQDQVEPFSIEQARERLEMELGAPIRETFAEFVDEPKASGSIGQVHYARLIDGSEVVIKIKRPGIERTIMSDLDLLGILAEQAERIPELQPFRPAMMVEEFSRAIQRELDFISEGSYTAKFHELFRDDPSVRIPRVHWEFTTSSVLTLERLSGVKMSDAAGLERLAVNRKELARRLMSLFMRQFFSEGLFHADPHPGNIFVMPSGTLGLIDFGMVGHLDTTLRSQLATSLIALVKQDLDLIVDIYADIGVVSEGTNYAELKPDLISLLDKYYGVPVEKIDTRAAFMEIMRIARRHEIVLPRDFVLLGKAFVTVMGQARELDPQFDLAGLAAPQAKALLKQRFSPDALTRTIGSNLWHLSSLLHQVPRELRQITKKILAGQLQMVFRHEGLERFSNELDRTGNRLAFSIVVASVVIGSSLIIHAKIGPSVFGNVSAVGFAGYAVAFAMGALLMIGILRSGRL